MINLDAILSQPATHAVTTTYECGKARRHECRSLGAANNFAIGERRKVGKSLIDRDTGLTVKVVRVEIEALPNGEGR